MTTEHDALAIEEDAKEFGETASDWLDEVLGMMEDEIFNMMECMPLDDVLMAIFDRLELGSMEETEMIEHHDRLATHLIELTRSL